MQISEEFEEVRVSSRGFGLLDIGFKSQVGWKLSTRVRGWIGWGGSRGWQGGIDSHYGEQMKHWRWKNEPRLEGQTNTVSGHPSLLDHSFLSKGP